MLEREFAGPQIRLVNLASGSNANALLLQVSGVTILVDCGQAPRKLAGSLQALGLSLDAIDIVFVTHEHGDHVRALPQLQRTGATIVTSKGTANALGLSDRDYMLAAKWKERVIAGIELLPLPVSHDSSEPLGVLIRAAGLCVCVMTDLGRVDPELLAPMAEADIIVIEANHDVDMLRNGPYPASLKRRVLSSKGHLSNADSGVALRRMIAHSGSRPDIWLAHLSETNNRSSTAVTTVQQHLPGVRVSVLERHAPIDLLAHRTLTSSTRRETQSRLWPDDEPVVSTRQ